jgi:hypothetical protein
MLTSIEDEEHHEFSTVSAATVKLQQQSRHLSNIDFTRMTDEYMPLEEERGVAILDGYAMQPGVGASSTGKNLEFEQISQRGLRTPNLDPMLGPGPYFSNDQLSAYIQHQGMIDQSAYYQDSPYQLVFNHQHANFDPVQAMHTGDNNTQHFLKLFANEQYNFQNMHEETFPGPNDLLGPRPDSGIDQSFEHIDPQLLER